MFSALASNAFVLLEMMFPARIPIESATYGFREQYTLANPKGLDPT